MSMVIQESTSSVQGFDSSSGLVMVSILILRSSGVDREFSRSDLWSRKIMVALVSVPPRMDEIDIGTRAPAIRAVSVCADGLIWYQRNRCHRFPDPIFGKTFLQVVKHRTSTFKGDLVSYQYFPSEKTDWIRRKRFPDPDVGDSFLRN